MQRSQVHGPPPKSANLHFLSLPVASLGLRLLVVRPPGATTGASPPRMEYERIHEPLPRRQVPRLAAIPSPPEFAPRVLRSWILSSLGRSPPP